MSFARKVGPGTAAPIMVSGRTCFRYSYKLSMVDSIYVYLCLYIEYVYIYIDVYTCIFMYMYIIYIYRYKYTLRHNYRAVFSLPACGHSQRFSQEYGTWGSQQKRGYQQEHTISSLILSRICICICIYIHMYRREWSLFMANHGKSCS